MRGSEEKVPTRTVLDGVDEFRDEELQRMGPEIDNGSIEKPKTEVEVQIEISGTSSNASEASTVIPHRAGVNEDTVEDGGRSSPKRGFRFWMIMLALAVTSILSALEGTIVSTALPTIVEHLGGAKLFIWTVNGYYLTSMMFQPLYGQTANIFGRRRLMIVAVSLFMAGSAIGGVAQSMGILIAGRAIQGIGGGGIQMLNNLIISDIVPLRERGTFQALLQVAVLVGTACGPFAGGIIVQSTTWRWVFFLNLPTGGLALLLVILFLRVNYDKQASIKEKLKRIDYIGNAIFVGSVISILLSLTWAGTTYPWSSHQVLLPLTLGFLGLAAFLYYESSASCLEPTMPPHLFKNLTTTAAFTLTFLYSLTLYWLIYYLPLYFQAVLLSTPSRSGIQLTPLVIIWVPFAQLSGRLVAKTGRYKPLHLGGFALTTLGMALLTLLGRDSSAGQRVGFQVVVAAGLGLASTTLPAVLAALDEKDVATATGTWAFLRSFGIIWGVTLPAVVFNNRFDRLVMRIGDANVRTLLGNGKAYEHGTKAFIEGLEEGIREEIRGVYEESLRWVWGVGAGVAGLAFCVVWLEREVRLRRTLETEFGMREKRSA